jgi:hypothetical protein
MHSIRFVLLGLGSLTSALNTILYPFDFTYRTLPLRQDLEGRANGTCNPRPRGSGPVPPTDTAFAFLNYTDLESFANNAKIPLGYHLAFQNLHASSTASDFLGYIPLDSYDSNACAANCTKITGCTSVNIFFERDPTLTVGPDCPNPASSTMIKCAFWGGPVSKDNTKNAGYIDNDFVVAIAGSNGYVKGDGSSRGATG